ncbi:hypothetical protein BC567DRAFT_233287 [Phyllosticta citribraziliensis]
MFLHYSHSLSLRCGRCVNQPMDRCPNPKFHLVPSPFALRTPSPRPNLRSTAPETNGQGPSDSPIR